MKYFVYAVEVKTGLPYERELHYTEAENLDSVKEDLIRDGYQDIRFEEGWNNLEEMYEYVKSRQEEELTFKLLKNSLGDIVPNWLEVYSGERRVGTAIIEGPVTISGGDSDATEFTETFSTLHDAVEKCFS